MPIIWRQCRRQKGKERVKGRIRCSRGDGREIYARSRAGRVRNSSGSNEWSRWSGMVGRQIVMFQGSDAALRRAGRE